MLSQFSRLPRILQIFALALCALGAMTTQAQDVGSVTDAPPEQRIERLKRELKEAEAQTSDSKTKTGEKADASEVPSGALVVVEGKEGAGSGFIGQIKGRIFFITNIHVLGACRGARLHTLEDKEVQLTPFAFLSKHRDLAIVPVSWQGPFLEVCESLNSDKVQMEQQITVMGNSDGTGVVTHLRGKINGIGPEEIEVSAKFVPGNSGSPIIQDQLGKVIGVAAYLRDLSAKTKWTEDSDLADIRRFGYRLDGNIEWQRVSLDELYRQSEIFDRFEDRTIALGQIGYMLVHKRTVMTGYSTHESLGYLFDGMGADFNWNRGTSSANNVQILKHFVDGVMRELQSDRRKTENTLTIEYFKQRFQDDDNTRDDVAKTLEGFRI